MTGMYPTELLQLAAGLPDLPRLADPAATVRKVSRLCGSTLELDVRIEAGRLSALGYDVEACALGQAALSVLAQDGIDATAEENNEARAELHAMLKTGGPAPRGRFARLSVLEGAKAYPARHGSVMLAFDAAAQAFAEAAEAARP